MNDKRVTPTGVYGLLRRSPTPLTAADVADQINTGVHRSHVILKALVAAGLATVEQRAPWTYSPIEVESLGARRKRLKFARELWQETRPRGNDEARIEIMRFRGGRYD